MHTNTRSMTTAGLLATAILLVAALPAQAQVATPAPDGAAGTPPRYAVELILFTYTEDAGTGTEVFLPETATPPGPDAGATGTGRPSESPEEPVAEFGDTVQAAGAAGADPDAAPDGDPETIHSIEQLEIRPLPQDDRTLGRVWQRLEEIDVYRPVLWTGWTQAVYEEAATPAIDLRRLGTLPLEFDGTVELYLSRYLHLVVDVVLEERGAPAPPVRDDRRRRGLEAIDAYGRPLAEDRPVIRYRIEEDRIMRDGETRYYDHPRFGIIARVRRVETPSPEQPGPNTDILLPPSDPPR